MKIEELTNDVFYQDVEETIEKIKRKKNRYLFFHYLSRVITFTAGVTITILTGLKDIIVINPDKSILFISGGITLLAAFEGLFSLKEKAMNYDLFLHKLRALRNEIGFDYIEGLYQETKKEHFKQFQAALEFKTEIIKSSFD
ncbi:SLATT domain-containing protein [Mucilaginibacter sp.]|uniref:SLATT domain-containing protein n=1 Tax=Mucilaginibacter sp. TaxID=1882438 RepID=UPI002ED42C83